MAEGGGWVRESDKRERVRTSDQEQGSSSVSQFCKGPDLFRSVSLRPRLSLSHPTLDLTRQCQGSRRNLFLTSVENDLQRSTFKVFRSLTL